MGKIDLGSVSAFDIAVKNGYAGTEADWVNDIANASEYSSSANESAQHAESSAEQAAESAEEARIRYGSPLVATTASAMTDTNRVYVYTGSEAGYTNGNWYYHNGTAWVSGGAYNGDGVNTDGTLSVEGMPADAKAVGALIGDIDDLETVDKTDLVSAINEASKSGGGGITETQKELIVAILRNALYSSDQSENIDALEEAFANPVSYITASIYLHGNTIYTDDTLDTLRQYLTVIAYFEDGTNQAVTGYALSGTLTAGTSVITVSYRDATTTVNVPVSQAVTRYTITNNLTGVTNSNTDTTIAEGNTYTGVLSANTSGYTPTDVSVTVGGTDVTSTVYDSSTHTITITNVQGDIVIVASEAENPYAPAFELATPLIVGDTTDPRINDTANNRIATGVTVNDDENWTMCVDFTSLLDGTVSGNRVMTNDNNQVGVLFSSPNWIVSWHGGYLDVLNDFASGKWKGLNFVAIVTHESNTSLVNVYGTASGTITKSSIQTASSGQTYVGNTAQLGTVNRFAIYKRILTTDEIAAWIGE